MIVTEEYACPQCAQKQTHYTSERGTSGAIGCTHSYPVLPEKEVDLFHERRMEYQLLLNKQILEMKAYRQRADKYQKQVARRAKQQAKKAKEQRERERNLQKQKAWLQKHEQEITKHNNRWYQRVMRIISGALSNE